MIARYKAIAVLTSVTFFMKKVKLTRPARIFQRSKGLHLWPRGWATLPEVPQGAPARACR